MLLLLLLGRQLQNGTTLGGKLGVVVWEAAAAAVAAARGVWRKKPLKFSTKTWSL